MPRKKKTKIVIKGHKHYTAYEFNDKIFIRYLYAYDYNLIYPMDKSKHIIEVKECAFMRKKNIRVVDFKYLTKNKFLWKFYLTIEVPMDLIIKSKTLTKLKLVPELIRTCNIRIYIYEKPRI